MKGRKYSLIIYAPEKSVSWDLFESQLQKLAQQVEEVCAVPVDIDMKNYNTTESETRLRYGRLIKEWGFSPHPKKEENNG